MAIYLAMVGSIATDWLGAKSSPKPSIGWRVAQGDDPLAVDDGSDVSLESTAPVRVTLTIHDDSGLRRVRLVRRHRGGCIPASSQRRNDR